MDNQQTLSSLMTDEEIRCFREFIYELNLQPAKHLLRNDIVLRFTQFLDQRNAGNKDPDDVSSLAAFLAKTQEMLLLEEYVVLLHRKQPAQYHFYRIYNVEDRVELLSAEEFLDYRKLWRTAPTFLPKKNC